MSEKRCTKCGVTKALDEFSKHKSRKDGRNSHCKKCNAKYQADRERNRLLTEGKLCGSCGEQQPINRFGKTKKGRLAKNCMDCCPPADSTSAGGGSAPTRLRINPEIASEARLRIAKHEPQTRTLKVEGVDIDQLRCPGGPWAAGWVTARTCEARRNLARRPKPLDNRMTGVQVHPVEFIPCTDCQTGQAAIERSH